MGKASTYQRRARDFAQRADWDAALAELRHAATADPGNPMLQNQMGDLFLRKEEVPQACQHFEKAIELYASLGLHNNAVALCRKVIRLCPSRLEVRYQLACLRHEQGLRSEATAFFLDYFDHLPVQGDAETRALEQRSTEILESYPESAPVGKILEKLEDAGAFLCAFELVQRLAQRATDAGDDDAARRYTTKMRSLRVLVESHGGDLPEGAPQTQAPEQIASDEAGVSSPEPLELQPEEAPPQPEPDTAAGQTWTEPSAFLDSGSLEVPDSIELEKPETPEAEATAPELELPDETHAIADHETEAIDAIQSFEPDSPRESEIDAPAAKMAEPVDPLDSDSEDGAAAGKEYELPESSLEDVAALWADEEETAPGSEPDEPEEATASLDDSESLPELDLGPGTAFPDPIEAGAAAAEALSGEQEELPRIDEGPPEPVALESFDLEVPPESAAPSPEAAAPESDGTAAEEPVGDFDEASKHPADAVHEVSPSQTTPLWEVSAQEAAAPMAQDEQFQEPVWVPEGDWNDPSQAPSPEAGSMHELSEVIDTFRKQMAMALGDDAAARYDLGVAYYEMGLYDEALCEFEAAQPSAALRERSLEMMAACMAMQGRHAEILEILAPALEGPAEAERALGLRYCMGVACEALGRRDEARQHFELVARIDSGYRDVSSRLQAR